MKLNLRIPLFITLIVASIGIGTAGVHASTDCQRLFRAYKDRIANHVHHKVSAATAARWAAWNKAHPHYHPRPTIKEAVAKIDFACQIPVEEANLTQPLPPMEMPPLLPAMIATDLFTPIVPNQVPSDIPNPPPSDQEYPPVYYPTPPTVFGGGSFPPPTITSVSPVPEPTSLILMTTAFGALLGMALWKRSKKVRRIYIY